MALVVIDTLDLGAILFQDTNIIHISGLVYAIAYQNGSVLTTTINDAGGIGSVIDTLAFDTVGSQARTIHIAGNTYAIVYRGHNASYNVKIVTVDIDAVGNIGAVINSLTLASEYGYPDIVHVSGNVYAIVYQGSGRDGYLKTITIEDNGTIGSVIDTLEFDTGYGGQPYIIHVSGVIYAIAYRGGTWIVEHDCRIVTVDIDNTGNIGGIKDSLTIPPLRAGSTKIQLGGVLHISGNIFAVYFSDFNALPREAVFLKTFDVDVAGNIGAVIDTSEVGFCGMIYGPEMTQLSGSLYALAYEDNIGNGTVKTITIGSDGAIGAVIDTLEFDTSISGRRPGMLSITTSMLFIACNADISHGALTTVGLVVLPTVTTNPATNVKETSATLNGILDDDGEEACEVRFQYGLTTDYGTNTAWQPGKETGHTFSQAIVELVGGNLYHFRAQAKNSAGTASGNDRTLATITPTNSKRAYALSREEL